MIHRGIAAVCVFSLIVACGQTTPSGDDATGSANSKVETEAAQKAPAGPSLGTDETVRLDFAWTTEGFSNPEGVAAAADGTFFVSNVAGGGTDKDGEGWISKVGRDGEIIEAKWAEGLDAPKGMTVWNGLLYVADIDTVRIFNAETGSLERSITVEGAKFLNDVTVWDDAIFISDSQNAHILRLQGSDIQIWLEDSRLGGVNGLLGDGDGDRMIISTMSDGNLLSVNKEKTITEIATGMTDGDGIALVDGGYLVSAWRGEIYFVSEDGEITSLLNTRDDGILQNDLTRIDDMVLVPNWEPSTLTGWRLTMPESP
ncbi:MAG: hypothetical protein AAFR21_11230 [Pseudomonadota bacterium]